MNILIVIYCKQLNVHLNSQQLFGQHNENLDVTESLSIIIRLLAVVPAKEDD
jgi:hypothetical protein